LLVERFAYLLLQETCRQKLGILSHANCVPTAPSVGCRQRLGILLHATCVPTAPSVGCRQKLGILLHATSVPTAPSVGCRQRLDILLHATCVPTAPSVGRNLYSLRRRLCKGRGKRTCFLGGGALGARGSVVG
jgi:hypothetical protein